MTPSYGTADWLAGRHLLTMEVLLLKTSPFTIQSNLSIILAKTTLSYIMQVVDITEM